MGPGRQRKRRKKNPRGKVILTGENLVSRLEKLPLDGEDAWRNRWEDQEWLKDELWKARG